MDRKWFVVLPAVVIALGGSTACATKKFVRSNVEEVNNKVDSLGRSVEETQERTRQNERRISDVDKKADGAASAADKANMAAADASLAARAAGARVDVVNARTDALDKASKRLIYEITISEEEGHFKFGKADLPETLKAKLDVIIEQLKADPQGSYFEIEGHTDDVGAKDVNERIGLQRAEAVKKYLYEQHQIPLFKINVISYGQEKPVAPNKTPEGRAQNRRIVIKVLS